MFNLNIIFNNYIIVSKKKIYQEWNYFVLFVVLIIALTKSPLDFCKQKHKTVMKHPILHYKGINKIIKNIRN